MPARAPLIAANWKMYKTNAETEAFADRFLGRPPELAGGDRVIGYEPVWAIGTGRTATARQAAEAIAFIRSVVAARGAEAGEAIRILYGGSVRVDNAAELLSADGIDGALVGGASLDPDEFRRISQAALR